MGNQQLKEVGENAAAAYLAGLGFRILRRNWRLRFGEVDIVAMDGDCLVFVEVKARANESYLPPEVSVDWTKRQKIRRLAEAYITFEEPIFFDSRFDVVSVVVSKKLIRHIPNAF